MKLRVVGKTEVACGSRPEDIGQIDQSIRLASEANREVACDLITEMESRAEDLLQHY